MLKRQRTLAIILVLVFSFVALTGCSSTTNLQKLDEQHAGFWDRYFVIPFSHLLDWFKNLTGNYGWSILIVTFFVRLVIFPLTLKQQQSARAMQEIQPKMQKIRNKYQKDPQKQQEEMMKLFQEHQINPMAGCLPMLVQIPILFAFYHAIMRNPHISSSSFLYMELGQPDPYYILPVLAAVTTYLQLIVSGATDNPQMRLFIWFMPLMIFVLTLTFPSALSLYWVCGNIFTILQYALILNPMKRKEKSQGATS